MGTEIVILGTEIVILGTRILILGTGTLILGTRIVILEQGLPFWEPGFSSWEPGLAFLLLQVKESRLTNQSSGDDVLAGRKPDQRSVVPHPSFLLRLPLPPEGTEGNFRRFMTGLGDQSLSRQRNSFGGFEANS